MWRIIRGFLPIQWAPLWAALLRVAGLFIIFHEALSNNPAERPVLYLVACAMMGITLTIPVDKKRQDKE